ncbi:3-oxoacyl-[acyl-carrier] synthase I [Medicago truncatula]|uniref:beta-ketoacyl-[acyl-carrier-protein] synthase I n=1 Tax=Medicago truncatula TaxID=3880 RepID=A0A072TUZ4_MEDTR|nr:3-oxoacyl-[acyl-carrier] synthase I [Medicago truncatula]
MTDPRSDGLGVSSCINKSLENAGVSPEEVNYVNAHATSTVAGDLAEVYAIKQVFKDTSELKMNGTKSMIGHSLGAAGGLEAIATIKAITSGWLHPTINQDNLEEDVTIDTVPNVKKKVMIHVPPHVAIHPLHPHKILTRGNLDPTQIEDKVWL